MLFFFLWSRFAIDDDAFLVLLRWSRLAVDDDALLSSSCVLESLHSPSDDETVSASLYISPTSLFLSGDVNKTLRSSSDTFNSSCSIMNDTTLTHNQFLTLQSMHNVPTPLDKWENIQKESVKVYQPGISTDKGALKTCFYCSLSDDPNDRHQTLSLDASHAKNALVVFAKRNATIESKRAGRVGDKKPKLCHNKHPNSKAAFLPSKGFVIPQLDDWTCRLTVDRLASVYNHWNSTKADSASERVLDSLLANPPITDRLSYFVQYEQYRSQRYECAKDFSRCQNRRSCAIYVALSEEMGQTKKHHPFGVGVTASLDNGNDLDIFDRCPKTFNTVFIKDYFPVLRNNEVLSTLYTKYGDGVLEYINIYERELCFTCTMMAMGHSMLACFRDTCYKPYAQDCLAITVSIYKAIVNELVKNRVFLKATDIAFNLPTSRNPNELHVPFDNTSYNDYTIIKEVQFFDFIKSFKDSVVYSKDSKTNQIFIEKAYVYPSS